MALDRWFVPMLRMGATLTAAGALVRLGGDSFGWALGGQLLVAIAQPLVLNAVTKLASEYVAPTARPAAISLGAGGTFVGLLLGLLLGPALGSATDLQHLLLTEAAFAVVAAAALWTALRSRPAGAASLERAIGPHELRAVWDDHFVRALCALAFAQFVLVAAIGAVVLPALPVLLELAEQRAGAAGASAAALLWLAGNLGGIALALPVGALVHHAVPAFGLLALAALAGLPLAWRLRPPPGKLVLDGAIVGAEVRE